MQNSLLSTFPNKYEKSIFNFFCLLHMYMQVCAKRHSSRNDLFEMSQRALIPLSSQVIDNTPNEVFVPPSHTLAAALFFISPSKHVEGPTKED